MTTRRQFLTGLGVGAVALLAAPAIVRTSSLMPVKSIVLADPAGMFDLTNYDGVFWYRGYEPSPGMDWIFPRCDPGGNWMPPEPVRIVKRMTEADWAPNPFGRRGERSIMDAPGLDRAIEFAMKSTTGTAG